MADPATYRPAPGEIPDEPGVYRFRDEHGRVIYVGKAKSLRQRLSSYFQDLSGPALADAADGHDGGVGAVDRRRDRGRGPGPRVLVDQGVRPAVQRQVPRRQVVPVPRRDDGRRVPAGAGHARRQAEGHPLLRAVRARVGHPRDRRPAPAGLPGPHLLGRRLPARQAAGPAVPARLHRQVLGAVRRADLAGRPPRAGAGLLRLPGGGHGEVHAAPDRADEGGGERARLRAGRAPAGRHPDAGEGDREERRRARGRHGRGHLRPVRRRARGRGAGVPRPRRPHPRSARLGGGEGRGRHGRRAGRAPAAADLRQRGVRRRRRRLVGRAARGARPGPAAGRRAGAGVARWPAREQGVGPHPAARRQARARGDRPAQRRALARPAPHPPGRAT